MAYDTQRKHNGVDRFQALLLATAAVYLAAGLHGPLLAVAGAEEEAAQMKPARTAYRIPAQPLGSALTRFGDVAGLHLVLPSGLVAGRTSAPVRMCAGGASTVAHAVVYSFCESQERSCISCW